MNFNSISSSVLVFDIIDRYNIKSQDFVTRSPNWISACLDDMKLTGNTESSVYKVKFNNNRVLLPEFCKSIDWVVLDGNIKYKGEYNESLYIVDNEIELNRKALFEGESLDKTKLDCIDESTEKDTSFYGSDMPFFYRISNGWLHTNVAFGTIDIKYNKLQTIFDSDLGLDFPTIPDEFNVREAIICFILKTIIMRGYVHPILNFRDRDVNINPSLGYIYYKSQARIYSARPNSDSRSKWFKPLGSLLGKRPKIYIESTIPEMSVPITGFTPQLPKHIRIATGLIFEYPVTLKYLEHQGITLNVPIRDGFNYFFISVPKGDAVVVRNSLNMDVSDQFIDFGTDIDIGYFENTLYRSVNQFYTALPNTFTLIIN